MASTCGVYGVFTAYAGALINNNCTISSVLTVGTISPPVSGDLILKGNGTTKIDLGNTVTVTGNVSMPGYMWAAGVVNASGIKQSSTGMTSFTSGGGGGTYTITFPTSHPLGKLYIVTITGRGVIATLQNSSPAPTATTFQVQCYAPGSSVLTAGGFNFMVLAS